MSLLFGQIPAAFQSGMGLSAGQRAPPARRCRCPAPTTSMTSTIKVSASTWAGSDLTSVTILNGPGMCLGFPWVLPLSQYPSPFPGHAYRYCSAYGTWAMAISTNKTWANYTECALLFSSDSRSREKVTLLVRGAGKRGWDGDQGIVQQRPGELLGAGCSSPLITQTSPAPPVLSAQRPGRWAWSAEGLWSSALLFQEVFDRLHLMYTIGYSISLACLIVAVCILSYFK